MELLKEVGAIAGIASFLGLALLCLLYFAQARDVRRLRESASFLVEGDGEAVSQADRTAAAVATKEPEKAAAAAAATAPTEAEAFRRAELARQAAERRQRFEQRRRPPGEGRGRLSDRSSIVAIVVGAIVLLAGIGFGVTRILDDGGDGGEKVAGTGKGPCPPSQTRVAVLNGTATAGLAANFAGPLKQNGYKTGPIGNTESPIATSVVMFDPQTGTECGPGVSRVVGIEKVQPMSPEIQSLSEGDPVAVILGEDQAGAGTTTDSGI